MQDSRLSNSTCMSGYAVEEGVSCSLVGKAVAYCHARQLELAAPRDRTLVRVSCCLVPLPLSFPTLGRILHIYYTTLHTHTHRLLIYGVLHNDNRRCGSICRPWGQDVFGLGLNFSVEQNKFLGRQLLAS